MTDYLFRNNYPTTISYQCPPKEANNYVGTLYRYTTKSNAVTAADYKYSLERKTFTEKFSDEPEILCKGGGLSSFTSIEAAEASLDKLKKNSPVARKKFKGIYKIDIDSNDGALKDTPTNNSRLHHTWWHKKNIDYLSRSIFIKEYWKEWAKWI